MLIHRTQSAPKKYITINVYFHIVKSILEHRFSIKFVHLFIPHNMSLLAKLYENFFFNV